jgi:hypothetical protein
MALKAYILEADLNAFAKAMDIAIGTVVDRVVIAIYTKVVERTPVDTGRARASWMINEGSAPEGVPEPDLESYPMPATAMGGFTGTEPVYITSNLPYMERLENGWSKQAPAGMVRIALAEVETEIEMTLEGLS